MTNEPVQLERLTELWGSCKAEDDKKDKVVSVRPFANSRMDSSADFPVKGLLAHIHGLSEEISAKRRELLDKSDAITTIRQNIEKAENKIGDLQCERVRLTHHPRLSEELTEAGPAYVCVGFG